MDIKNKTRHNIVLSEDVVAKMATVAALEIDGVCEVVPNTSLKKIFSPKDTRSVDVKISQDSMVVDIYVKLKVGVNISSLCVAVQENIKKSIQNMTGYAVSKVNVFVADIDIPTDN